MENKNIIVFGASSGVGAACVKMLDEEHCKIYAISRRGKVLDANQNDIQLSDKVELVKCDVCNYKEVEAFLSGINAKIDSVVSCVGVGFYAPIDGNYSDKWKQIIETNVLGNVNILSNIIRFHKECNNVVVLGSIAAKRVSDTPGNEIYRASKVALEVFLSDFRRDLRCKKNYMKVCNIQPGFISNTDFGRNYYRDSLDESIDLFSKFKSLSPEEVATTIINVLAMDSNLDFGEIIIRPTEQPT